eukprot:403356434
MKKFKRKYNQWQDAVGNPEVQALIQLQHPNIVKLKEVIRHDNTLYMLFELLDMDLYKMLKMRKNANQPYNDSEVRRIMWQVVQGLAYVHKHGYFHRDLKPDNILVQNNTIVKISDFGLVRETKNIFALGCIMAELYLMRPIFPGASELDQLNKIAQVLGTPSEKDWSDGHRLSERRGVRMPQFEKVNLGKMMQHASRDAVELMEWMFKYDPKKRPDTNQILKHRYFVDHISQSEMMKALDVLNGRRPKTNGGNRRNEIESLKIGAEGISIKKTEIAPGGGRDRSLDYKTEMIDQQNDQNKKRQEITNINKPIEAPREYPQIKQSDNELNQTKKPKDNQQDDNFVLKAPEIKIDEESRRLLQLKEKQRRDNEEQTRKYLANQGGYELQPVQPSGKKMKVTKRPSNKVYDVEDPLIPKRIQDPSQLGKIKASDSDRNEIIKIAEQQVLKNDRPDKSRQIQKYKQETNSNFSPQIKAQQESNFQPPPSLIQQELNNIQVKQTVTLKPFVSPTKRFDQVISAKDRDVSPDLRKSYQKPQSIFPSIQNEEKFSQPQLIPSKSQQPQNQGQSNYTSPNYQHQHNQNNYDYNKDNFNRSVKQFESNQNFQPIQYDEKPKQFQTSIQKVGQSIVSNIIGEGRNQIFQSFSNSYNQNRVDFGFFANKNNPQQSLLLQKSRYNQRNDAYDQSKSYAEDDFRQIGLNRGSESFRDQFYSQIQTLETEQQQRSIGRVPANDQNYSQTKNNQSRMMARSIDREQQQTQISNTNKFNSLDQQISNNVSGGGQNIYQGNQNFQLPSINKNNYSDQYSNKMRYDQSQSNATTRDLRYQETRASYANNNNSIVYNNNNMTSGGVNYSMNNMGQQHKQQQQQW